MTVILQSTDYLKLRTAKQEYMELCPVAPIHQHPMVNERPVYFSEIIVNSTNK